MGLFDIIFGNPKKQEAERYIRMGDRYISYGAESDALWAYTKAINLDPENQEISKKLTSLAKLCEKKEDFKNALECYIIAERLCPTDIFIRRKRESLQKQLREEKPKPKYNYNF